MQCPMSRGREKGNGCGIRRREGITPRFDRNANTGGDIGAETRLVPALQTVFHDGEYPSHVSLPSGAEGVRDNVYPQAATV